MKLLLFLSALLQMPMAAATWQANTYDLQVCPPGTFRVWTQSIGHTCVPRMTTQPGIIGGCFPPAASTTPPWMQAFPGPLYQQPGMPWWAYQGNMYYPNMHYPGPWSYPGIQPHYYPGQGQVFAAKPNVYIQSIHEEKKFELKFSSEEKLSFLVTTPPVDKKNTWKGKIVGMDKFEVEDINYDYLFYDIRLPKEKMQFDHGGCTSREEAIAWMLSDLKEMGYPAIALQDFEEHWRVKIPDYPFYCIYPQYNQQLDQALPVEIKLEQSSFTRALYILEPHKTEPDIEQPHRIPLPNKHPGLIRPETKITRENMFREWGVAFIGNDGLTSSDMR